MPSESPVRLLIVEDDDSLRDAIVRCLRRADFSVIAVGTGADAIDAARDVPPDAVLMDVLLPDAGGLGTAQALKRAMGSAVPVVFMTALSTPNVRILLAPAPVLFKPFTRRELLESLRHATRSCQAAARAVQCPRGLGSA